MRRAALGLLAAAGCNQIWGNDGVVRIPTDLPDADPNWPRVRLTTQIVQTNPANGYGDQPITYGALSPAPAIQIGPIDPKQGPLMNAAYEPDGPDPGRVAFPPEYLGNRWRLVYTLDDGVPREVHWAPTANLLGHIVEPLLGRADRVTAIPPGSGYRITPPNLAPSFQHVGTRVFTTGIWTEGLFGPLPPSSTVDYAYPQMAKSLSGPLGLPESSKRDHAILVDFKTMNGCRTASGTAAFPVPDLVAGTFSPPAPQPTYFTADRQVQLALPAVPSPIHARIQDVLGTRSSPSPNTIRWEYGYVPSLSVFGFTKTIDEPLLGDFLLPGPRMIPLTDCGSTEGAEVLLTPAYADSVELRPRFPRVVHAEIVDTRVVSGVALRSGFTGVVTSTGDTFTSDFSVAAARTARLTSGGAPIADLADDPDSKQLPAGTRSFELQFDVETMAPLAADYFDVTLFLIDNGKLARQRVYTITDRTLSIEAAFLLPGSEYVFEIRSYRGRPDVVRNNFSVIAYPQYAAAVFTRTFRTPP